MAASATLTNGPIPHGAYFQCEFDVTLDTSFLSTGEPLDLTSYFSEVKHAWCGSNNTLADNAYLYNAVHPKGTALESTNFLITAHYSPAKTGATEAAEAFAIADAANLSTVGKLSLFVIGKKAVS